MTELGQKLQEFISTQIISLRNNRFKRYGLVLILLILVLPFKFTLQQIFGDFVAFYLFTFIITISAWYGGLGPGIFATIVSSLLNEYFFVPPINTFSIDESLILTLLFTCEGIIISVISESRRKADRQKDDFLAFASHELKNPLSVIKGYANLIARQTSKSENKKLKEYATQIESYVDKTTNLVNDLLDMTKIEAGQLSYNEELFNINDLVNRVAQDQTLIQNTHQIKVSGKSQKKIYGDRYRLGQVLINLISNAIKYSPNKNKIKIGLKDIKNGVEIKVQDYGIGMTPKDQKKVFQRYYRSRNKRNKIEGLGIGLYITSQIIKKYKGRLAIKSQPGKGSTFFLYLPTTNDY